MLDFLFNWIGKLALPVGSSETTRPIRSTVVVVRSNHYGLIGYVGLEEDLVDHEQYLLSSEELERELQSGREIVLFKGKGVNFSMRGVDARSLLRDTFARADEIYRMDSIL